jgi:hypothetical protein
MSNLDLRAHLGAPRPFELGGGNKRGRAIMPKRIFVKILFSTLAVALSVYVWRQR